MHYKGLVQVTGLQENRLGGDGPGSVGYEKPCDREKVPSSWA